MDDRFKLTRRKEFFAGRGCMVITDAKGLYLPRSWGSVGAACVDPIPGAAKVWRERLLAEHGADVVVPMTHQGVELDRALAEPYQPYPVMA